MLSSTFRSSKRLAQCASLVTIVKRGRTLNLTAVSLNLGNNKRASKKVEITFVKIVVCTDNLRQLPYSSIPEVNPVNRK